MELMILGDVLRLGGSLHLPPCRPWAPREVLYEGVVTVRSEDSRIRSGEEPQRCGAHTGQSVSAMMLKGLQPHVGPGGCNESLKIALMAVIIVFLHPSDSRVVFLCSPLCL